MKGVLMPIKAGFTMKVFKNLRAVRLGRAVTIIGCLLCVFSIVVYYHNWDYIGRAFSEVLPRLVPAECRVFLDDEFSRIYELTDEQAVKVLAIDLSPYGYTPWAICTGNRMFRKAGKFYHMEATDSTVNLNPTGDVFFSEKVGMLKGREQTIFFVKSKQYLIFHSFPSRGY